MLEELLALGHSGAEYDAWLIKISDGDQFGSGFVEVNPNSKIPALLDRSGQRTLPRRRLWPFLRLCADEKRVRDRALRDGDEAPARCARPARCREREYLSGSDYTIADIAVFPWYGGLVKGSAYGAAEFLSVQDYGNVQRWADTILARPAVKRGRMVNRMSGDPSEQLRERHDASDFDTKTQDKLAGTAP